MAKETSAKKRQHRKTYRAVNKEIYRHLATMARQGKHKKAVALAKTIFFVQIGNVRRSLTTEEAAEMIIKGMS